MAKPPPPFNNPFGRLKLEKEEKPKPSTSPAAAPAKSKRAPAAPAVDDEAELFLMSVGEVAPVKRGKWLAPPKEPPSAASVKVRHGEIEAMTQLCELVTAEGPFDLASSDELIEGRAPGLDPRVVEQLKAGDYPLQADLDLHGLTRAEAKAAVEGFVQRSRLQGHRCVRVVTGRGLHSQDQIPVLKQGVQEWLTQGRVARQVLAFATARPEHGGAGAIYVLLRR